MSSGPAESFHRYVFTGTIHPARAGVQITLEPGSLITAEGERLEYCLEVLLSNVTVQVARKNPTEDLATFRNQVENLARKVVDVLGFINGCGYDLEITQVVKVGQIGVTVFGVDIPMLKDKVKLGFAEVVPLTYGQRGIYLSRALNDLRDSIRNKMDTAFYCYRAIESMRQFFDSQVRIKYPSHSKKQRQENRERAWSNFRNTLSVSKVRIFIVAKGAEAIRHGEATDITSDQKEEIYGIAWDIVLKYIDFARSGYIIKESDSANEPEEPAE